MRSPRDAPPGRAQPFGHPDIGSRRGLGEEAPRQDPRLWRLVAGSAAKDIGELGRATPVVECVDATGIEPDPLVSEAGLLGQEGLHERRVAGRPERRYLGVHQRFPRLGVAQVPQEPRAAAVRVADERARLGEARDAMPLAREVAFLPVELANDALDVESGALVGDRQHRAATRRDDLRREPSGRVLLVPAPVGVPDRPPERRQQIAVQVFARPSTEPPAKDRLEPPEELFSVVRSHDEAGRFAFDERRILGVEGIRAEVALLSSDVREHPDASQAELDHRFT